MIREKHKGAYEWEFKNGLFVLRIKGEIDHHSACRMRDEIDGRIREFRPQKVILDLSEVDFMDSSGLGLILGRYSATAAVGGELVVLNPSAGVSKILALAGAERLLKIERINIEEKLGEGRPSNGKRKGGKQK